MMVGGGLSVAQQQAPCAGRAPIRAGRSKSITIPAVVVFSRHHLRFSG